MILDTSALLAILRVEPEAPDLIAAINEARTVHLSVVGYVESGIVLDRSPDPFAGRDLDRFLREAAVILEPVTVEQAHIARAAYCNFGRGAGHPARLNFGDCFAYALAKARSEPLLFKGEDFRRTDIESVVGG